MDRPLLMLHLDGSHHAIGNPRISLRIFFKTFLWRFTSGVQNVVVKKRSNIYLVWGPCGTCVPCSRFCPSFGWEGQRYK